MKKNPIAMSEMAAADRIKTRIIVPPLPFHAVPAHSASGNGANSVGRKQRPIKAGSS
jgi:hypothetical protein